MAVVAQARMASGIRPLNKWRDLSQVADLIEAAFAGDLDRSGVAALREMRSMSRAGPFVWALDMMNPEFGEIYSGFVWIEAGRIVGNVTVNRSSPGSMRWVISNVAVFPSRRGRGIGRALMEAALAQIKESGGNTVLLQVRRDNAPARHIYEAMGFVVLWGTTHLHLTRAIAAKMPLPPNVQLRLQWSSYDDARQVYELARDVIPIEQQLMKPLRLSQFKIDGGERLSSIFYRCLGQGSPQHWVVEAGQRLVASLSAKPGLWKQEHQMKLIVHPDWAGKLALPIANMGLDYLSAFGAKPVVVRQPDSHQAAIDAFIRLGFREERTLIWMKREL